MPLSKIRNKLVENILGYCGMKTLFFLLLSLALYSGPSNADIAPPNTDGCADKKAGESCMTDGQKKGSCVARRCYRNDYSNGVPPEQVGYDCLTCEASAAKKPSSVDDKSNASKAKQDEKAKANANNNGCSHAAAPVPLGFGLLLFCSGLLIFRRRKNHHDRAAF